MKEGFVHVGPAGKYTYFEILVKIVASLVVQIIKNLPAVQETLILSLGPEDPLEKGLATHSTILT